MATFSFPVPDRAREVVLRWKRQAFGADLRSKSASSIDKKDREEIMGVVLTMAGMLIIVGMLVAAVIYLWHK
jgi:hypothetical protein